jgi:hypothetical protein
MQGRPILILGKFVDMAVDIYPPLSDAVRIAPKQRTERASIVDIPRHIVEAEHEVIARPAAIERFERHQDPAIIGDADS